MTTLLALLALRTPVPTFAQGAAPVLYAKCAPCHRPGDAGPMPFLSYDQTRPYAPMIANVVASGAMPPWKPVGMRGAFHGERRLTEEEQTVLIAWAKAGAPAGDLRFAPNPPAFASEWQLGPPDVVLRMPEGMAIPAEGDDIYRLFPLSLAMPRGRYLRAMEVRPGNRRVVHHVVVALDATGKARELDAKDPRPGYEAFGGFGFVPSGFLGGYAPGQRVRAGDGTVAASLPKGRSDVVVQMHYHPTGKPETDRSEVGLYFTDQKPAHNPAAVLLGSEAIDIPAGAKGHLVKDEFRLPTDFNATSVFAHAHLVGRSVRLWAELPGGAKRDLLRIDDWDFRWQDTYPYAAPIRLPKDTLVRCEWTYDNSAANPRNPNAPPRRVLIGENSTDEMAGLILGGYCDDGWGDLALGAADLFHLWQIGEAGKPAHAAAARARSASGSRKT